MDETRQSMNFHQTFTLKNQDFNEREQKFNLFHKKGTFYQMGKFLHPRKLVVFSLETDGEIFEGTYPFLHKAFSYQHV